MPYYDIRLNWVHDTVPPPSRRLEQTDTVPRSELSENSRNSVPRNILDPIPSASHGNNSSASRGNTSSASRGNISRASRDNVSSASHKNNSSAFRPVTLCIPIPNVVPSIKTVKTRCPPPPRAARERFLSLPLLPKSVE